MYTITENPNIMNALVDTIKMNLFSKIKTGNNIIDGIVITISISFLTYLIKIFYYNIYNFSIEKYFNYEFLFSCFFKIQSIELEGTKSQSICIYTCSSITSCVFSDRFKSLWYHIMDNIENNKTIYQVKEYYCNAEIAKTDLFIVSQNNFFKIEKDIYAITKIEQCESTKENKSKSETKTDKIKIKLYSYKLGVKELTQYVDKLTNNYLEKVKDTRKNSIFIYTLNKTIFENCKLECWGENLFNSVKTFKNTFFDGKEDLLENLNFFLKNKDWYYEKGRPYTLGIALYGPPGTGKTSIIKAIANETKRHIIVLSLKIIKTRTQLINFFFESRYNNNNDINEINFDNKIIVIEDIDCIGDIILDRSKKNEKYEKQDLHISNNSTSGNIKIGDILQSIVEVNDSCELKKPHNLLNNDNITLDDILNLWDGINETSGRILIISSNHYDKLDPALVRPGRIDLPLELGNASHETISQIYHNYYGRKINPKTLNKIKEYKYSPAQIINICNSKTDSDFLKKLELIKIK